MSIRLVGKIAEVKFSFGDLCLGKFLGFGSGFFAEAGFFTVFTGECVFLNHSIRERLALD